MVDERANKEMDMPEHGDFCWSEFAVTDLEKSKAFYSNVFGWEFKASENAGNEMAYMEFSSCGGDQPDSALYQIDPNMFGGTPPPPHIAQYVSVDNVDATLEKAKTLGGTVVFGPYDIPNVGRMAVITDPTGANISLITLSGIR